MIGRPDFFVIFELVGCGGASPILVLFIQVQTWVFRDLDTQNSTFLGIAIPRFIKIVE
jgi:hypothetical protein